MSERHATDACKVCMRAGVPISGGLCAECAEIVSEAAQTHRPAWAKTWGATLALLIAGVAAYCLVGYRYAKEIFWYFVADWRLW